ncbi:MAG: Glycine-tRNA ligase [Microgenomates group bacterium GW2011_GWF1_46_12]|nr:MAG: Glycine-tRNA ligase [Microgenomates group bacterium GW2011_GWF1_46_12]
MTASLADITSLAKRRGFFYPGSDIYGGLANTWDYGPLGAELKKKIKDLWWEQFITRQSDMVGIDSAIISSAKIWEASGHVPNFADAMVDCKTCHTRTRADHLIEGFLKIKVEGKPLTELSELIKDNHILCPSCGGQDWTPARSFNQLFPVHLGILAETADLAYLRGETPRTWLTCVGKPPKEFLPISKIFWTVPVFAFLLESASSAKVFATKLPKAKPFSARLNLNKVKSSTSLIPRKLPGKNFLNPGLPGCKLL